MNKAELIAQITGFDPDFFGTELGNDIKLQRMPEYALGGLALILQAAADKKNAAILPPRLKSPFNRRDFTVIVRIDNKGRMAQNGCGTPEYDGIVYKAEGIVSEGKLGLEQVEFYPSRQISNLSAVAGKPLRIQSGTIISDYATTASYLRQPNGELKFDDALINFRRLSGNISHEAFGDDKLNIPAEGPASYRFNGNWKRTAEIPADGSKSIEVKPFPFQNRLSVKRITEETQIRFDVTQSKTHSELVLKQFDGEATFSFLVLASSPKPETPPSGTIQIDLSSVEAGETNDIDDMAVALLALAPAEIFDSGT